MHAALAVHPASGNGSAGRLMESVAARLRPVVDRLDVLVADTVEESRALMTDSRAAGLDVLVVLGGDGAAHQGVQFCAESGVALGLVPAGTGNDFARALGIPEEPHAAADLVARRIAEGERRRVDLGRAGGEWFATVLCSGFDALVTERANRLTWPRGPRRYDVAILAELVAFRPRPVVLRTDVETLELDATMIAVGNTPFYGGGMRICPGADPEDGRFDVTVVGDATRRDLLRMLPGVRSGRHVEHPAVRTLKASQLHLAGSDLPVYADGEPLGGLPIDITCVPGALTVVG
ncbi:YegS/Rv2252/BmrU family lipid kinase [Amycolatopsis oliviviridis]|uniref:Sphingosine kinase n=1 Tax=Amycolatopsis oliviviridis TaxID=1471590 RepID=A0ABQ3L5Q8_9PSEU|nr:YegS/Rv2252/BmrU family lipid kinase [Amycolatopsis oliviviridis]GHH04224.1 sphingosine kinase [Amycolatopsis oliviviridis]